MKQLKWLVPSCFFLIATGCAIKPDVTNQYQLEGCSASRLNAKRSLGSILINFPNAVSGYQTDAMLYMEQPFEVAPFLHNAWVAPPAEMLFPLLIRSLNSSGYFQAVVASPEAEAVDYQLNTQLIELKQNFTTKPSRIDFIIKVVLSKTKTNRILSSKLFEYHINCPADTPYGGVIAANQATKLFTAALTNFIVAQIKQSQIHGSSAKYIARNTK